MRDGSKKGGVLMSEKNELLMDNEKPILLLLKDFLSLMN